MQSSTVYTSPVKLQQYSPRQVVYSPAKVVVAEQVIQEDTTQQKNQARIRYLRKLYFLLFFQLALATWLTNVITVSQTFAAWVKHYYGFTLWTTSIGLIFIQLACLVQKKSFERFPLNWLLYIIHDILFAFLAAYCEMKRGDEYIHYTLYFLTVVVSFQVLHNLFIKYYLTFQSTTLYILAAVFLKLVCVYVYQPEVTLEESYFYAISAALFGFYLVWETETVFSKIVEHDRADYITGSFTVYSYVLQIVLGVALQIKLLLVKARV